MRGRLILALAFVLSSLFLQAQLADTSSANVFQPFSMADLRARKISINLADADEVELALRKIHSYKYLEELLLEGTADEEKLKKLFFRVSVLKNLSKLCLRDNELQRLPESIASVRSLQTLVIESNPEMDFDALFEHLHGLNLTELSLRDNDLKAAPLKVAQLGKLKKFQLSGGNTVDYASLVEALSGMPSLVCLSIPVNYLTELPANISKLRSLQVLDVSENNFTELPDEISALKNINNLSIQGNLLLDPVKDLEKLKGNDIRYLSLDKEIAGDEVEKIRRMFPAAEIYFPLNKETLDELVPPVAKTPGPAPQRSGELKSTSEVRILSGAYAMYPAYFQGLIYSFDTLTFEERYSDLRYANVYEMTAQRGWRGGNFSLRRWLVNNERGGLKSETWFRLPVNDQYTGPNYPELRAFTGMYWVYEGSLNKKDFYRKFIRNKQKVPVYNFLLGTRYRMRETEILWNDIRIDFNRNNSLFTVTLKHDSGFVSFNAYPVVPGITREKCRETYNRRYSLYKRALLRRIQNFARIQARNRKLYDDSYRRMQDYGWKELQMRMSDEEKLMSREQWLEYYDAIIAHEQQAIDNTALSAPFILRGL